MRVRLFAALSVSALVLLAACAAPNEFPPAPSTPVPVTTATLVPASAPTQVPVPVALPTSAASAASATPEAAQRRTSTPSATGTNAPTRTPAPSATPTKPRPNIILVLADDLDAAEFAYMPKLKALIGDQGVTLPNYYVAMSLCCPSRSTTLRGQYPHNTQVFGNDLPSGGFQKFFDLGEEKSTIATWLQDAGYTTMLAGKYLNGYPLASDPKHIPPGWTEWYSAMKGNPYSEYNYTLNENGKMVMYGKNPEDYGTDVYVGKTVDFFQRTAKTGKPFFVYLAPYAPHQPYTPAPRHENLFPDLKAPRTANYNESDVSDKPAYIKDRPSLNQKTQDMIDEDYRKRLQSLQAVDEGIESIVNTLKASGQLDNTFIFFTSDNGYHLGNHRQITGKIAPYEEELRVSMMVRGPGVPAGKTVQNLGVNIDLAPTWADIAGVKPPDFVDGRSLVPLLGNNPPPLTQWRQAFSLENGEVGAEEVSAGEQVQAEADPGMKEPQDQDEVDAAAPTNGKKNTLAIPPFRGVHTQTMSYVEYTTGEKELYDLKADPFELNNLASKADPKLLSALAQRVKDLSACKQDACRTAENAPIQ